MSLGVSSRLDDAPVDLPSPVATQTRRQRAAGPVACVLLGALLVVALLAASRRGTNPPAPGVTSAPRPAAGATTCKVGLFVETLHASNVTTGTFNADLWMWSVCPDASHRPLDTVEFTNANSVQKSFLTTTKESDGSQYTSMRVTGQFRHGYSLNSYPFDRQRLQVQFEDSGADSTQLMYAADTANTACAPQLSLDDWTVRRCSLEVDRHEYATTFGDPAARPGTVYAYARGTLSIDATRSQPLTEYLKSTSIIYPSILLIIISFFLMTEATNTLGARMSTAGGALFSVALSMKALSSQLNADSRFTLLDAIGLLTLLCVVFAGGAAMWCQRRLDAGVPFPRVRSASRKLGWSTLAAFMALNSLFVWR
jgi:hypothetical protein